MKKSILVPLVLLLLPLCAACAKSYDYTRHISECRRDVYRAETEEFSVTLNVVSREYPYADDGIACPATTVGEVSLVPQSDLRADFEVCLAGDTAWGGEMSFRNVRGDYAYSESLDFALPETVTLRISWGEETREVAATSVRTQNTLSPEAALGYAVAAERETVEKMTENGVFCGEFRVRLLKRDATYYYVGIIGKDGSTLSLLLDSETGDVLARRQS